MKKLNKSSFAYIGIHAIVQAPLMDRVNVILQEFAVLHNTDAMEDSEVVSEHETGSITNRITNTVHENTDRLCGLVVRVSGYRYRGPGFDPRRYQIF